MSEYRVRATGEVKSQGQIRRDNPNMSLPRVWKQATFDALGIDPVLAAPQPAKVGNYTTVVRNGVVQDANGNWVYNWIERDMFSEYTRTDVADDGTETEVTVTKAEQEAEYQTSLDDAEGERVRQKRNELLKETDYLGLSDVTMSAEMTTYRQALRDITDHADFPNLADDDWPTKP